MRKYLLPSALILCFGLALAVAQNISRSVQLSQDPSGPIGFDTNNNIYFPKHVNTNDQTTPTIQQCGTLGGVYGTDTAGIITGGATAGTCGIAFRLAYATPPACTLGPTTATPMGIVATTAGFVATYQTTPGYVFSYNCVGIRG